NHEILVYWRTRNVWFGLRLHSRRQRRRIRSEPKVWTYSRIECDAQAWLGCERRNDLRYVARSDEVAAVIEQHERSRRKMFQLHVSQRFGQAAAINRGRRRRVGGRLLGERDRDDRQGNSEKCQTSFCLRPIGQLFHPNQDSR